MLELLHKWLSLLPPPTPTYFFVIINEKINLVMLFSQLILLQYIYAVFPFSFITKQNIRAYLQKTSVIGMVWID
jgi:hypothetical protein